jgi:hypothetical protein
VTQSLNIRDRGSLVLSKHSDFVSCWTKLTLTSRKYPRKFVILCNTFTGYKLLSTRKLLTRTDNSTLRLEAFAETDFNEIFSGRQPLHDVTVFRRSTELPAHPEDGDGVSSETSENHVLTRPSARENFIELQITL